jgi:mono/diheme cytochrome c family protein
VLFVWNLVQTFRGAERRVTRRRWTDATAEAVYVLSALFLAAVAGGSGYLIGRESAPEPAPAPVTAPAAGDEPGRRVFADAGCGSCHTLAAAGASGTVGPNLDELRPAAAAVEQIVRSGRGAMPPFGDRLEEGEIEAVARFVASEAG